MSETSNNSPYVQAVLDKYPEFAREDDTPVTLTTGGIMGLIRHGVAAGVEAGVAMTTTQFNETMKDFGKKADLNLPALPDAPPDQTYEKATKSLADILSQPPIFPTT